MVSVKIKAAFIRGLQVISLRLRRSSLRVVESVGNYGGS
jgi:hypothetical protein